MEKPSNPPHHVTTTTLTDDDKDDDDVDDVCPKQFCSWLQISRPSRQLYMAATPTPRPSHGRAGKRSEIQIPVGTGIHRGASEAQSVIEHVTRLALSLETAAYNF